MQGQGRLQGGRSGLLRQELCKGKGGCASAASKHSCSGKNACKGQGGCKVGDQRLRREKLLRGQGRRAARGKAAYSTALFFSDERDADADHREDPERVHEPEAAAARAHAADQSSASEEPRSVSVSSSAAPCLRISP